MLSEQRIFCDWGPWRDYLYPAGSGDLLGLKWRGWRIGSASRIALPACARVEYYVECMPAMRSEILNTRSSNALVQVLNQCVWNAQQHRSQWNWKHETPVAVYECLRRVRRSSRAVALTTREKMGKAGVTRYSLLCTDPPCSSSSRTINIFYASKMPNWPQLEHCGKFEFWICHVSYWKVLSVLCHLYSISVCNKLISLRCRSFPMNHDAEWM